MNNRKKKVFPGQGFEAMGKLSERGSTFSNNRPTKGMMFKEDFFPFQILQHDNQRNLEHLPHM